MSSTIARLYCSGPTVLKSEYHIIKDYFSLKKRYCTEREACKFIPSVQGGGGVVGWRNDAWKLSVQGCPTNLDNYRARVYCVFSRCG